jgi:hypothetical protein
MSVIPGTGRQKLGRSQFEANPSKKFLETPFQPIKS